MQSRQPRPPLQGNKEQNKRIFPNGRNGDKNGSGRRHTGGEGSFLHTDGTVGYATNPDGGTDASALLLTWSEAAGGIFPRSRRAAAPVAPRRYLYPIPLSHQ